MKKSRPLEWAHFVAGSVKRPIVIPVKLGFRGRVVTRHYRLSLEGGDIRVERQRYCCWRYYATLPLHSLRHSLPPEGVGGREYKLWVHLRQRFAVELAPLEKEEAARNAEGLSMLTPRPFCEEHLRTENEQIGYFELGEGSQRIVFTRELVQQDQDVMITVVYCEPGHSLYALYNRWFKENNRNPEIFLGERYPTGSFKYRLSVWLRTEVGRARPFQFVPRPIPHAWSGVEQQVTC